MFSCVFFFAKISRCLRTWLLSLVLVVVAIAPALHLNAQVQTEASPIHQNGSPNLIPPQAALQKQAQASASTPLLAPELTKPRSQDVTRNATESQASSTTDANAAVQKGLQAMPALTGTGINVANRSKTVLAHLSAVLRFYRETLSSMQKVGEVSDVLYQEEAEVKAKSVAQLAFQFARNTSLLLAKVSDKPTTSQSATAEGAPQTEAQRLQVAREHSNLQLSDLQAQNAALTQQITNARRSQAAALRQEQEEVEGRIDLQKALSNALSKLSTSSETQESSGLMGDIDRLQRSAPELLDTKQKPIAAPMLENLSAARDAGVSSQATVIFELVSTRHDIDQRMRDVNDLRAQAQDLRTPILKILRATMQQGQALQNATPEGSISSPDALAQTRKQYAQLTATFSTLANATLPLSEELLLLDQSYANLAAWRNAVEVEYNLILRSLLLRVLSIVVALTVLFFISELWRRTTTRYVQEVRRRRQLLLVRRIVIGFLSGCILIFGFVTQFNSLATFAGFITAGIAVGLQTILLSVAAYFFIIGRFGIRVGDRITVAGVTGDVIEVGLVRFYLIELTGTGTELHSTGRVAVFANSVLFQAGTPLYKQLPGTEYAWHELTIKLNQSANYQLVIAAVTKVVNDIYASYKARIDQQHQQVENWMDNAVGAPDIESRLQLAEGGLQFALLFPVEIKNAADIDSKITEQLVSALNENEQIRNAVAAPPLIKAAIKA